MALRGVDGDGQRECPEGFNAGLSRGSRVAVIRPRRLSRQLPDHLIRPQQERLGDRQPPEGEENTRLGVRPHRHVTSAEGNSALVARCLAMDAAMTPQAAGNTPSCRKRWPVSQ